MKHLLLSLLFPISMSLAGQENPDIIAKANNYVEQAQYDSAHLLLDKQLIEFPNDYILLAAKAEVYLANYESKDAIRLFEEAIAAAPDTADYFRAKHYLNLGLGYFDILAHRESLEWTNLAARTCPKIPSTLWNDILYNKALQFGFLNQTDSALIYYQKVYELDKVSGDSSAMPFTLSAIGGQYMLKGNQPLARDFYRQSLVLRNPKHIRARAKTINNIAMTFIHEKKHDSAAHYLRISYDLHESIKDTIGMASRLLNLGDNYSRWKKFGLADDHLKLAKAYFEQMGMNRHLIYIEVSRAIWYKEQGKYRTSIDLLKEAIDKTESKQMTRLRSKATKLIIETFEQAGLYKEAFEYQLHLNEIKARSERESPLLKLKEIEMTNRIDQKQKEMNLLAENKALELANERKTKIFLLIILVILLIAFGLFIRLNRQKNKVKQLLLEEEIDSLRLKISSIVSDVKLDQIELDINQLKNESPNALTDREFEILQLAVTNKSNQEIAEEIFISVNTVKYHLKNIYAKLGVSTRLEAREALSKVN